MFETNESMDSAILFVLMKQEKCCNVSAEVLLMIYSEVPCG